MKAIRASATARLPLPFPSSASSPPKTATFPVVKSAAAGVQLRHDQYSVLLLTTTLSLLTLFTAAPNEAKALSLSKEQIVSSLTQVEETVGQVQEVGSNVLDIAGRVLQKVVDTVKPGVDMAVPILKQAGGDAVKIASPAISEASKKAQEAIQISGLDTEPVFSAAKTVADAAQQTTKVIEGAKPMAFSTVETISSSDPLAIVATGGALFLAYLFLPPVWSAISFNLRGYKEFVLIHLKPAGENLIPTKPKKMVYKSLDCITFSDISDLGIPSQLAHHLYEKLTDIIRIYGAASPATWHRISNHLLRPNLPFSFHQMMYYGCYKDFGPDPPAWLPDPKTATLTNIGRLLERRGKEFLGPRYKDPISSFSELQEFSVSNPEVYWNAILDEMDVSFSVPPQCILRDDPSEQSQLLYPGGQWLPGAYVNPAKNCLGLNSKRSLDDITVIWRDEGDDGVPVKNMTLQELRWEVWLVAYALETLGLEKGSAVAINMPMDVYSVVIYLAIVLAGYVVVSIADSFAPAEISTRLVLSKAKAIFTQDFIIRGGKRLALYSRTVDAHSPTAIVIPSRGTNSSMKLRDGDISWHDFLERVKDSKGVEFVSVERPVGAFTNILFSSGTTGQPKAIPWTLATPFKAAADGWCHGDIHKGDIVAWPTNLGWMMGPWLVYASLLNGASVALYNGSPVSSSFAKFVQDAKVTMLGVIPSIVRVWKTTNCTASYDWSAIRRFASTGEASSVDEYLWLMGRARYKPIIEYCGGTEIGGAFISGSMLQPQSLAAFSTPVMGCRLFILGEDGIPLPSHVPGIGELALGPLIFGASSTLLNGNHYAVYFKGMPVWNGKVLRRHGDVFERTSRGYYHAHGRADDTMNLGGIKVSSVEIERICNEVDNTVLETAAIGVPPPGGGPEMLVIAVVFKDGNASATDINKLKVSLNSALQKKLNPLFKASHVVPIASLPRTATNKVMRRVLRQQLARVDKTSKL